MGWLRRKREKMIDMQREDLVLKVLPDVVIRNTKVYQNKASTFEIHAAKSTEEVAFLPYRVVLDPILFKPRQGFGTLIDSDNVKPRSVGLQDFPLMISRLSFQATRAEEESLFGAFPNERRSVTRIRPVKPPPKPPSFRAASLEERLRWILTPPIHELLSDPQLALPERPFPFQTVGIKWLYDRDSALLADEMGLGKTMQALIAARLLWRAGLVNQILVICPKTLIPTWQTEIRKWWPQVVHNVMLAESDRQFFLRAGMRNIIIKIINYEALAREVEWLKDQTFSHDLVIIDEAQRIKNPEAKTSIAVKALKGGRRWALTGTPLENRIEDLISIFDFVCPGLFHDSKGNLSPEYARTCLENHYGLRDMIRLYMLRRLTKEVISDLPEKIEQDIGLELDPEHRKTYDRLEEEGIVELNAKGENITVTHIFALINKLRQVCNFDPATGASTKLERLLEDLEEVCESHRKALIFSQFVEEPFGLKRLAEELEKRTIADRQEIKWQILQLHGQIPPSKREAVKQKFLSDPDSLALLLNYSVGGLGLNLQAANYVFLFDRWWNPAVEDQAVKRAHRIGQTEKVFVRRFYCKDTIEERILRKLFEKRRLFRNVIDEGRPEPDSLGLSEEEIFELFNLTVRPRKKSAPPTPLRLVLENMDPNQFELLVARLYESQGYTIQHRGRSHDEGIDILAEKTTAGGKERIVVQCKHQQGNVGRPVLQHLWGVITSDPSFTRGDLVSSSCFTGEAKEFAQGKRLTLIDRDQLGKLVEEFNVARFEQPPA